MRPGSPASGSSRDRAATPRTSASPATARRRCPESAHDSRATQRLANVAVVPGAGLEPARLAARDFESLASTDFATRAREGAAARGADYGMRSCGAAAVAATMCVRLAASAESMPQYKTIEDAIGDTPLVRLQRLPGAAQAERG